MIVSIHEFKQANLIPKQPGRGRDRHRIILKSLISNFVIILYHVIHYLELFLYSLFGAGWLSKISEKPWALSLRAQKGHRQELKV
jgi:hypothetical protein